MVVVELLAGLALVAAVGAGWRRYRYPGGWDVAFSSGPEHRAARQDLDAARRAVRTLRTTARRELAGARNEVDRAERAYRRRIEVLEQRLEHLREDPGRGRLITGLGPVSLHEHVLVFLGNDVTLAGLQVRFERGRTDNYLYVTLPGGHTDLARYPVADRAEDEVRRFGVTVRNAIVAENRLRERQAASIRKTEAELVAARADTGPQEAARRRLEAVTARQREDKRIGAALARLEDARDEWEAVTGRRPPP